MLQTIANLPGVRVLGKEAQRKIMGGNQQQYTCTCSNQAATTWYYTGSSTPSQSTINRDIKKDCAGANAECGWRVVNNPLP